MELAHPPPQFVVIEFPPLYEEIAAKFRIHERRDVIFSFGSVLYNPYAVYIPDELIAHETIHGGRQGKGEDILDWWQRYIDDPEFRLVEETLAHRAEYQWLLENVNRRHRRRALKQVAAKLASPLYGPMVSVSKAKKLLWENKAEYYE